MINKTMNIIGSIMQKIQTLICTYDIPIKSPAHTKDFTHKSNIKLINKFIINNK